MAIQSKLILGPKQKGRGRPGQEPIPQGLGNTAGTSGTVECQMLRKCQMLWTQVRDAGLGGVDCTGQGWRTATADTTPPCGKMLHRLTARSHHDPVLLLGGLGLRCPGLVGESGSFICRLFCLPPPNLQHQCPR